MHVDESDGILDYLWLGQTSNITFFDFCCFSCVMHHCRPYKSSAVPNSIDVAPYGEAKHRWARKSWRFSTDMISKMVQHDVRGK